MKMSDCQKIGCRNLQTTCVKCGRIVCEKILPTNRQWISIKNRQPEDINKKYFVITEYGADIATWYDNGDGTESKYWAKFIPGERFPLSVPVTHWMPLPEKPGDKDGMD
jgi:methionyl-tRNA synthetase